MTNLAIRSQKNLTEEATSDSTLSRRQVIAMGATGLITLVGFGSAMAGKVYADATVHSTPALEEGPYWVDETGTTFHRSDVRTNLDGTNLQAGLPMFLSLTVSQYDATTGAVTPLSNAFIYMWQCNALGVYSDESAESTSSDTYLRGYQVSDTLGRVHFFGIYPGWYGGRTVHTHLRVRVYPNNDPTQTPTYDYETQLFYDDSITDYVINNVSPYKMRASRDTTNTTDRVYQGSSLDSDGVTTTAGKLTQMHVAEDGSHAAASFHLLLNLALTETMGTSGGGGTGGPGGGTGGPGGGTPPSG